MAKNKIENKISFDENLPQNILMMGERVEEDKNIYISQATYKEIHNFTKNKTTNESGGVLVGNIIEEFGKTNIVIQGFVEAKYTEATPTTLKFTHETWDYVHKQIDKKYDNGKILGWIHTHPDFGIFLSEYDKFIHQNFFNEEHQVAYVVDPIQHIEGFYFWINGKIEKCKGFYVFDKTGEKIEIVEEKQEEKKTETISEEKNINKYLPWITYSIAGLLIVTVIVFASIYNNLLNRMKRIETQQENLIESANESISYLQQEITTLNGQLSIFQQMPDATSTDAAESIGTPTDASTENTTEFTEEGTNE